MKNNHRNQIMYQKNDFNHHHICQLDGIYKCCKCKRNNTYIEQDNNNSNKLNNNIIFCLFCGTPNARNVK